MTHQNGRVFAAPLIVVALALFTWAPGASAWEWYLGGFLGGAFPQSTDFRMEGPLGTVILPCPSPPSLCRFEQVETRATDRTLGASLLGGAKAGACLSIFPHLCAELEFDYFQPEMTGQNPFEKPIQHIPDLAQRLPLARFGFRVYDLGLNLIGRMALLREAGYPLDGRLHLYAGAGPSFIWTTAKDLNCISGLEPTPGESEGGLIYRLKINAARCHETDTDFSFGVQALAGGKFFLTKHLALFSEYKFKPWGSDFDFQRGRFQIRGVDFDAHLVYVGLAFHF